jgi:hypothetical protein
MALSFLSTGKKWVLTNWKHLAIMTTFLKTKGREGKSKPRDAVQRAPVGGMGYG